MDFQKVLYTEWLCPTPLQGTGCDTRLVFMRSITSFNSEFSFSVTGYLIKVKEPSLSYYLPVTGEGIDGFMFFTRALAWSEMQLTSFRIRTRFVDSIPYDDNRKVKQTSFIDKKGDVGWPKCWWNGWCLKEESKSICLRRQQGGGRGNVFDCNPC